VNKSFLFLLVFIQFSSCKLWQEKEDLDGRMKVAKAFDYVLYLDDLNGVVPSGASPEDSTTITGNFIENWIRQKAVLHKAERNLDEEKKNVERKLEEYRNSLITYTYETQLVQQTLDTIVSEDEIEKFYEANRNNFELKDNIIKVINIKLNKNSPKLNKARDWFKGNSAKDRKALQDYCHQYALNYFLDDTTWLLFDDLLKEIPIKTYDKEQYLQNNRNIEIEDSSNFYMVSIRGFMMKNSTSPLSFERNNIRTMVINERKLKLIEKMEQEAYDDARKGGDVEVY